MPSSPAPLGGSYDLLVFCHLRWDFVYQRPQHLISRLSEQYRVLFVEEPWRRPERPDSPLRKESDRLHVLQPNVDHIDQIPEVLADYLPGGHTEIVWFYSPSFFPVLADLRCETVVYDCMDELSLFRGAPRELVHLESRLLRRADVVFTGGRSLYEAKKERNPAVYCFPSSVDQAHFARAQEGLPVPADIAFLRGPVVGYFGVIDERIDLDLLAGTADLLPEVQFVMIGPLAKIHDADLPRRGNLHYLGMKDYAELPAYLQRFDVAMMPFALNDATRFISPTKTLEYMAAGRPIVSTAIRDVVREYADTVAIVDSPTSFAAAVRNFLTAATAPDYRTILNNTSWKSTAARMHGILEKPLV
ncbi:glycosyltransferase [Neolewinella sp.]|uniref:glycosyltransferase n=1 Tax=Neolewinella sp. TaxID=2993543 RepID=UPI003B52707A